MKRIAIATIASMFTAGSAVAQFYELQVPNYAPPIYTTEPTRVIVRQPVVQPIVIPPPRPIVVQQPAPVIIQQAAPIIVRQYVPRPRLHKRKKCACN